MSLGFWKLENAGTDETKKPQREAQRVRSAHGERRGKERRSQDADRDTWRLPCLQLLNTLLLSPQENSSVLLKKLFKLRKSLLKHIVQAR